MTASGQSCKQADIQTFPRVLVFRALRLGDMLCAVPALRALRLGMPNARIELLGLPWAQTFAERFKSYIDGFISFPGFPGLPEQPPEPGRTEIFLKEIRARCFDLAIQMHGSGPQSNDIVRALGSRFTAGFYLPGQQHPGLGWYAPYPESAPEIERNLVLVRLLGLASGDNRLEFPITVEDAQGLYAVPELRSLAAHTYVCIHPGASTREKCWPPGHFSSIAGMFLRKGLKVVITGNRSESDIAKRIREAAGSGCIDAASPDLQLGSLAILIRDSRMLVCNDTGVSHLAAALNVPSVVIFSQADPLRWAPLQRSLHTSLGGNGRLPSRNEVEEAVRKLLH